MERLAELDRRWIVAPVNTSSSLVSLPIHLYLFRATVFSDLYEALHENESLSGQSTSRVRDRRLDMRHLHRRDRSSSLLLKIKWAVELQAVVAEFAPRITAGLDSLTVHHIREVG